MYYKWILNIIKVHHQINYINYKLIKSNIQENNKIKTKIALRHVIFLKLMSIIQSVIISLSLPVLFLQKIQKSNKAIKQKTKRRWQLKGIYNHYYIMLAVV